MMTGQTAACAKSKHAKVMLNADITFMICSTTCPTICTGCQHEFAIMHKCLLCYHSKHNMNEVDRQTRMYLACSRLYRHLV